MLYRIVRWNWSDNLQVYRDADIIVISLGKSGRTWFRVLLHKYLSLHYQIPFRTDELDTVSGNIPRMLYRHEMAVHYRDNAMLDRLLGRDILPDKLAYQKQLLVLVRDPRDIVVSSYFHKSRRSKRIDCTLSEFIRNKRFGIERIVWIMNQWHKRFQNHPHCLWISYEDMKQDTSRELLKVLQWLGIEPDPALIREAVDFGRFDNMQNAEAAGQFDSRKLRPRDLSDPDSFKVRKGKVKGYLDYFDSADIAYLDRKVAALDPFFRYSLG